MTALLFSINTFHHSFVWRTILYLVCTPKLVMRRTASTMYTATPTRRSPLTLNPYMGMGDATSALIGGGISAGVSLATSAASMWLSSIQLSHTADTATTQIVNGLAPLLQQNVNAYLAGPGTCADQAAALSAYMSAVQWLLSAKGCGNGAYGSAGNSCISDRFGAGGATDANAKYPWASYYYYPILNDPRAVGCAAQLAADNPDAGEESAVQNIVNLTSGSTQQTTAGVFDTSGSTASTSTSLLSGSVAVAGLNIPTEYLLFGGAALLLVMLVR